MNVENCFGPHLLTQSLWAASRVARITVWGIFWIMLPAAPGEAQLAPESLTPGDPIHTFEYARDLAVDDQGALYVLDGATASITIVSESGVKRPALSGASGETFSDPVAMDPTNGLTLILADAGRGELQWYSRAFRLLESRPLVRSFQRQGQRSTYNGDDGFDGSSGRPIAVASTRREEVFAVDESEGIIYKWEASGRFAHTFGGEGEGRLITPVDLAVTDDLLLVADRRLGSIMVYDRFGSFIRRIGSAGDGRIRAVSSFRGSVYITLPDEILVYSSRGRARTRYSVELAEPLVDCLRTDDALYLLTETKLYDLPIE